MRTRAVSSVGVVVVGLVPTVCGGSVFALLMAVLGILAFSEYGRLADHLTEPRGNARAGYVAVVAFACAPLLDGGPLLLALVAAGAVAAPLVAALYDRQERDAFLGWTVAVAGTLYVGLPLYCAVALRSAGGTVEAEWLDDLAEFGSLGWAADARGLAWVLIVILATWLGDTLAYLAGRTWGRRPLLPRVSPKKTVEGSLAGLAGSALVGTVGVGVFGLGIPIAAGAVLGLALGIVGQAGDLAESLLKRQAGVKDSGDWIPGHGGVLDRIDALLFALPSGWFLAQLIDRTVR